MKPAMTVWAAAMILAMAGQGAFAQTAPAKYTHAAAEKLYRQGQYAQDEALCKQALTDIEKAQGAKTWQLAEPLIDLATVYMRLARYADARLVIERADGVLDKTQPAPALLYGRLGINKGWRLYVLGDTKAALKVFEEALALVEQHAPGESIDRAELINNIGLMYEDLGDKEDVGDLQTEDLTARGRTYLLQGWEMRRNLTGDASPESGESLNNLGMHLLFNGRDLAEEEFALKVLRKSLDTAVKVYGENHPETAVSHATLALALLLHDKVEEAEKEVRIALPMTQKYLGDKHPDLSFELMTLGRILQMQKHPEDAEKKFLEALAINEDVYGKTHQNVMPALQALKKLYEDKGDAAKTQDIEKRIEKLSGKDL
jgi:tetratricopeptide (TPR) repeat protein